MTGRKRLAAVRAELEAAVAGKPLTTGGTVADAVRRLLAVEPPPSPTKPTRPKRPAARKGR